MTRLQDDVEDANTDKTNKLHNEKAAFEEI